MNKIIISLSNKKVKRAIYFLGIFSVSFIVSLLGFYFHAVIKLGHLPKSSINDPKNFDFYPFYSTLIVNSFTITIFSFLIWILITIYYSTKIATKSELKPVIITLTLYLIFVALLLSKISE